MAVPINVICAVPLTNAAVSALSGWTRETSLDARYVKMIPTSGTNPGTTSGSDSHLHTSAAHGHTGGGTHGHTWPATQATSVGGNSFNGRLTGDTAGTQVENHAHSVSADSPNPSTSTDGPTNWSTVTDYIPYLITIFIKSDGTPNGFPADAILYANASPPAGWAIADGTASTSNAVNRMLRGAATGTDGGATGGTGDAHAHTQIHGHAQSHVHALTIANFTSSTAGLRQTVGATDSVTENPHTHTGGNSSTDSTAAASATDTSTNGSLIPPWQKLIPIQNKTGGASNRKGLIAFWLRPLSEIPSSYALCDGTAGTPSLCVDKHVMGAASVGELGNTGGATTHTHTGGGHVHTYSTHTHSKPTTGLNGLTGTGPSGGTANNDQHSHNGGTNSDAIALSNAASATPTVVAATNSPSAITVAFIQLLTDDPAGPQLLMSD